MVPSLTAILASTAMLTLGACVVTEDDGNSTLTVSNRSSYFLEQIHLAEVGNPSWGPDLIDGALAPGEDLTILDLACDTYDVLVVDETGVQCELSGLDLCFDDGHWIVDDTTLDVCAFGP